MAVVRVKKDVNAVVTTSDGIDHGLKPNAVYDSEDQIVREFSWAFEGDNLDRTVSDLVEDTEASPGRKRTTRRAD